MNDLTFKENATMELIGNTKGITKDSDKGKALKDILNAMGLPLTNDNIMLGSLAMSYGIIQGIRQERQRHNASESR